MFRTILFIILIPSIYPLDPKCRIENIIKILPNRTIRTSTTTYSNSQYVQIPINTTITGEIKFAYYSKECVCANKVCIRKCCAPNLSYKIKKSSSCLENFNTNDFNLTASLQFSRGREPVVQKNVSESDIVLVDGNPCAWGKYKLGPEDNPNLQEDGYLFTYHIRNNFKEEQHSVNDYCLENKMLDDTGTESVLVYFLCFMDFVAELEEKQQRAYVQPLAFGMLTSIPFFFITFAVYAFIPELQNLHGKSLMAYVFTLMIAYLLLAFIQLWPSQENPYCSIIAFSIYYFFLVSFFWLNVMCFDIWWTFSGIRGFRGSLRDAEHKKFLVYNLYAWGFPTIFLSIILFMQFYPGIPENWITPQIGGAYCWFTGADTALLYFHLPLACVVVANVLLFMGTAFKIAKIKRDTAAMLKSKESQRHDNPNYNKDKQRFNLYLKLFIVMGVNWVMELISVIVSDNNQPTTYAWILTDLANTLQGVLIFIIFVCKRQIWVLLVKRYHILMGRPYHANGALSRTQTTSYSMSHTSIDHVPTMNPAGTQVVNSHPGSLKLNNFK